MKEERAHAHTQVTKVSKKSGRLIDLLNDVRNLLEMAILPLEAKQCFSSVWVRIGVEIRVRVWVRIKSILALATK